MLAVYLFSLITKLGSGTYSSPQGWGEEGKSRRGDGGWG